MLGCLGDHGQGLNGCLPSLWDLERLRVGVKLLRPLVIFMYSQETGFLCAMRAMKNSCRSCGPYTDDAIFCAAWAAGS